ASSTESQPVLSPYRTSVWSPAVPVHSQEGTSGVPRRAQVAPSPVWSRPTTMARPTMKPSGLDMRTTTPVEQLSPPESVGPYATVVPPGTSASAWKDAPKLANMGEPRPQTSSVFPVAQRYTPEEIAAPELPLPSSPVKSAAKPAYSAKVV